MCLLAFVVAGVVIVAVVVVGVGVAVLVVLVVVLFRCSCWLRWPILFLLVVQLILPPL